MITLAPGCVVHHGDCRTVLPGLALRRESTVVITDPPWPDVHPAEWGIEDCRALLTETYALCAHIARRLVIVLGCAIDPRCLTVPADMPFVRACWLRYAVPSYRGTILNSADVAYVYGSHEAALGKVVLPGEATCNAASPKNLCTDHPTPRRLEHMRWLVAHMTRPTDVVLDPFAGSGSTLLAALEAGRRSVGIEQSADYVAAMPERFNQMRLWEIEATA